MHKYQPNGGSDIEKEKLKKLEILRRTLADSDDEDIEEVPPLALPSGPPPQPPQMLPSTGWRASDQMSSSVGSIPSPDDLSSSRDTVVRVNVSQLPALPPSVRAEGPRLAQPQHPNAVPVRNEMRWKRGHQVGCGAFGKVFVGLNNETGELMAVKAISFLANSPNVQKQITAMRSEIKLLRELSHPNIVRYLYTERVDNSVNIFMEYVAGGSISSLLKQFGPLNETILVSYTTQITQALLHLHEQNVIHRDVKGANVLVDVHGTCKVCDFGTAAYLNEIHRELQGTPFWMAPEVILEESYNTACDIWSLGCTMLEMLTARNPFYHINSVPAKVMMTIAYDDIDKPVNLPDTLTNISAPCKDLLMKCLTKKAIRRPDANQVLLHPFLQLDDESSDDYYSSDNASSKGSTGRETPIPSAPPLDEKNSFRRVCSNPSHGSLVASSKGNPTTLLTDYPASFASSPLSKDSSLSSSEEQSGSWIRSEPRRSSQPGFPSPQLLKSARSSKDGSLMSSPATPHSQFLNGNKRRRTTQPHATSKKRTPVASYMTMTPEQQRRATNPEAIPTFRDYHPAALIRQQSGRNTGTSQSRTSLGSSKFSRQTGNNGKLKLNSPSDLQYQISCHVLSSVLSWADIDPEFAETLIDDSSERYGGVSVKSSRIRSASSLDCETMRGDDRVRSVIASRIDTSGSELVSTIDISRNRTQSRVLGLQTRRHNRNSFFDDETSTNCSVSPTVIPSKRRVCNATLVGWGCVGLLFIVIICLIVILVVS